MDDCYDITDYYPELLIRTKVEAKFHPQPKPLHERIAQFTGESTRKIRDDEENEQENYKMKPYIKEYCENCNGTGEVYEYQKDIGRKIKVPCKYCFGMGFTTISYDDLKKMVCGKE